MNENKNLKELRTKISNWLLKPRKDKSGIELSRTLMEKGKGKSELPHLCRWIKNNDYTKDDVEKVFENTKTDIKVRETEQVYKETLEENRTSKERRKNYWKSLTSSEPIPPPPQ